MIVYISIGNSDDKLSQMEWAQFHAAVDDHIGRRVQQVHGRWVSPSTDPWQNACWCVEMMPKGNWTENLRAALMREAEAWRQNSIAWAEVKTTEFLGASS